MRDRARARELAAEYLSRGDPTGWFEQLYREAGDDLSRIPWAELRPNPGLCGFWRAHPLAAQGKSSLVIGCGMGDDAEQLARWGFSTTAFDIAGEAIRRCKTRFPETKVDYLVADLFDPPQEWLRRFDLVFECYTIQALPPEVRPLAIERTASFVKPGGHALIIARGADAVDPAGEMPWPLTRQELDQFAGYGLRTLSFEDYDDDEDPPVRRFRVLLERQAL